LTHQNHSIIPNFLLNAILTPLMRHFWYEMLFI